MQIPYDQIGLVGRLTPPNNLGFLGTAFLCGERGCFVTSAHVIGTEHQNLHIVVAASDRESDYQEEYPSQVDVGGFWPARVVAFDPVRDLCVLRTHAPNNPSLTIGSTDHITVGDPLTIWGFPHAMDQRRILTYQAATAGAKLHVEHLRLKMKSIVLNFQTRPGQSGSPILRAKSTEVVAVLRGTYIPRGGSRMFLMGIDPASLNQTSYAVSAEYIMRMM